MSEPSEHGGAARKKRGRIEADGPNRSFLARAYPIMKKNNPNIPIMLREAAGTQPKVYARYGQSSPLSLPRSTAPGNGQEGGLL
jgi:hypothetical protein